MGGYAVYVWGSLGACALGMLIEPWLLAQRRQRILLLLRRQRLARQQETQAAADIHGGHQAHQAPSNHRITP